mmetsp:Transcript_107/g.202  ORF Transcript_107/g.202 Transcript_107/m.202 type:complete len:258 (-) Transcript_107:157-930(-)
MCPIGIRAVAVGSGMRGVQMDRDLSASVPVVLQMASQELWMTHLNLKRPVGGRSQQATPVTAARLLLRGATTMSAVAASREGRSAWGTASQSRSTDINALNSSMPTRSSPSPSRTSKSASTSSSQRGGFPQRLRTPNRSKPAASSALSRPALSWASRARKASAGQRRSPASAQRTAERKALATKSSKPSTFVRAFATCNCSQWRCERRRHARTSSHQGKRSSRFVRCSARKSMLKSRSWKSDWLSTKRKHCSAAFSW